MRRDLERINVLLNGVRFAAIAKARGGKNNEMEQTMVVSLRESLKLVSDPQNLDGSVDEVFQMMLGVNCTRVSGPRAEELESVTAVVGFGGALSGACVFKCGSTAARKIAAHMTGTEFEEVDDVVKDGIGEICNMLAGAWKGKVPNLAANCGLSVPAVITGCDYKLRVQAPEFQLHHVYQFEDASFDVTIVCDGLQ
jgi:chemotaxis protein CheX